MYIFSINKIRFKQTKKFKGPSSELFLYSRLFVLIFSLCVGVTLMNKKISFKWNFRKRINMCNLLFLVYLLILMKWHSLIFIISILIPFFILYFYLLQMIICFIQCSSGMLQNTKNNPKIIYYIFFKEKNANLSFEKYS